MTRLASLAAAVTSPAARLVHGLGSGVKSALTATAARSIGEALGEQRWEYPDDPHDLSRFRSPARRALTARSRRWSRAASAAAVLTLTAAVSGTAVAATPGGAPGHQKAATPGQQLFASWAAHWWQWALTQPVHTGDAITYPLLTNGRTSCIGGQHGSVWFLGGNIGGQPSTTIDRTCTVPTGVTFFMPVYDEWGDNSNCDGLPPTTYTTRQLRALIAKDVSAASRLSAAIDGRPIPHLSDARYPSPVFSYTTPADNLADYLLCRPSGHTFRAQTVHGAVSDGVYIAVAPLTAGTHTLRWRAAKADGTLLLDVTYHLTVRRH